MKTVLISPSFTKQAAHLISKHLKTHSIKVIKERPQESSAQALIIRSKDKINKDFLKGFPNLEIVVTATSGFDHIDLSLAKTTSVKFCYSPNANVTSASEITLWHMLNFLKKGPFLNSKVWEWRSGFMLGRELKNRKVSLIGLGRIGSAVAKKLQAFDCEVSAHDPYLNHEDFLSAGVQSVSLEQALSGSDIVSLHCPLTSKTKKMINLTSLALMQKHSILVNCARGPLINEKDLISSLKNKDILGACLDVFDKEPLSESSELRSLNSVTLSPHVGGYTLEAQNKSALEAAQQVKNWFEQDQPVLNILPPAYKWAKDLED